MDDLDQALDAALDRMEAESKLVLRCFRCGGTPSDLEEYNDPELLDGLTPDEFVLEEEGTLNRETGEFACTKCYIAIGMPANPYPLPPWTP